MELLPEELNPSIFILMKKEDVVRAAREVRVSHGLMEHKRT